MRLCKSWLKSYITYTKGQESPKSFSMLVGYSILSAAIGRKRWLPRIKYTLYPNIYVILIANSAKCRKSVALGIGRNVLNQMTHPPIIFAQKLTPEALIEAITKSTVDNQSYGLAFSDELSVFLSSDALSRGIIPILTNLYDSHAKWTYYTKSRGPEEIVNASISLLAATTKSDFLTTLPKSAIGGGFTSRLILVYEENSSCTKLFNPIDDKGNELLETPEEAELRFKLVADLNEIKSSSPIPMKFSASARKFALDWYQREQEILREDVVDGYFGRKHDTMFKLSMLQSISSGDKGVIELEHLKNALSILNYLEGKMEVLMNKIGTTDEGRAREKVLSLIIRAGTITHTRLLQKCWRFANAQELAMIIRTLMEGGEIQELVEGKKREYSVEKVI